MNSGRDSSGGDSATRGMIIAYLTGEMNPEAAREFERQLREDQALRTEFDRWKDALGAAREWVDEEPPGLERVREIPVPQISAPMREGAYDCAATERKAGAGWLSRLLPGGVRGWAIQGVAALAVFAAGYLFGTRKTESQYISPNQEARISEPSQTLPAATTPEAKQTPQTSAPIEVASAPQPAPRYVSEENGKMIVETTLAASGSRATWIVDGNFHLPSLEKQ